MNGLPWLKPYTDQWKNLVIKDKVPHAMLISGSKGLGKLHLAESMAQMALCENFTETGICNTCSACHLFKAGNHTDFSLVSAEKAVIKVEQIRKISRSVMLTSTRNQYKVILIKNAELMNKAAANALLKTLEEPPSKVIIILTTNEVGRLLATIKSRCMKLSVSAPSQEQMLNWLRSNADKPSADIGFSLLLNNTAPLMALEMLNNDILLIITEMLDDLKLLSSQQKTILEVSQNWINNNSYIYLNAIAAYFLALVKSSYNLDGSQNQYFRVDDNYSKDIIDRKISLFIKDIYIFNQRVGSVLKTQLLLEELLLIWTKIFNKP